MNVERLQEILRQIQDELAQTDIEARLQRLEESLQQVVSQPGATEFQNQVATQLDEIYAAVLKAPSIDYGPVWEHSVEELHLRKLLGRSLHDQIRSIFSRHQITPAVALQELQQLRQTIIDTKQRIEQTLSGLEFLGIFPHRIPADKAEIGILIPRQSVDNKLGELGEEAQQLSKDLNAIAEAVTGHIEDAQIQEVSSSDILLYVLVASMVAEWLANVLSKLIGCYKQILEIRDLRDQLKSKGVPDAELTSVEKHVSELMAEAIDKQTASLLADSPADAGRRNEVEKLVTDALWRFAKRLDEGYNFDVRASESADQSEDEGQRKAAAEIRGIRKSLDFINITGERILKLPPGVKKQSGKEEPKQPNLASPRGNRKGKSALV